MAQRIRTRYSKKQAEIVESESKKILEACKGMQIPSKNISKWYHLPNNLHRLLILNLEDNYIMSIFFGIQKNSIINMFLQFLVLILAQEYQNQKVGLMVVLD